MVRQGLHLEGGELPVARGAELGGDVVVARERVRLEVFRAVLDPLDWMARSQGCDNREDIAGINGHLAPEAAADIVRLDPDLMFGDLGNEREDGADGVR